MTKAEHTARPAPEATRAATDASDAETKAKRKGSRAVKKGMAPHAPSDAAAVPAVPPTGTTASSRSLRPTKTALMRARLSEPGGVSLNALIEVTGWQAHTLRAALSRLRKEGLVLTRWRKGEETIYAIAEDGTEAAGVADDSAPGNSSQA